MNPASLLNLKKMRRRPLFGVLQKGAKTNNTHLRHRLIEEGVLENRCGECGILEWRGKSLSLSLHHRNGDSEDNRLENLKLLCPNCHSQTENFAGRKLNGRVVRRCSRCETRITAKSKSGLCRPCMLKTVPRRRPRKAERPPPEQLVDEVTELGFRGTARKYGVSDTAIRKWMR